MDPRRWCNGGALATSFRSPMLPHRGPARSVIAVTAGRHALVIAAVVAAGGGAARAQPVVPAVGVTSATLRWKAPRGCPDETALRGRVDARLPRPLGAGDSIDATVTVERTGRRLRAHVRVWTPAADAERELVAERCDELADAVAVVLSRAVAEARARVITDDAAALLAISVDPVALPPPDCDPLRPGSCPEPIDPLRRRPRRDTDDDLAPRRRPPMSPRDGGLRATTVSGAGISPHVGFGVELGVWFRWRGFAGEMVATRWLERLAELPASQRFGAAIGLDALAARACWNPDTFGPRICVLGERGTMSGRGVGLFDAQVGEATYSAIGLGISLRARLRPHLALVGGFDMLSAIARPRFVLDRGTLLHQPDPFAGRVGFGFEVGWY